MKSCAALLINLNSQPKALRACTMYIDFADAQGKRDLRPRFGLLGWVRWPGVSMSLDNNNDEGFHDLQTFTGSALFNRTFAEGMSLVEETARYLDGRGREESRTLPRKVAVLYAGESMRVTTRLMQAASWLLVQRAVHEGDMRAEDAARERYRLGSKEICLGGSGEGVDLLPATLQNLLVRSDTLYRRIARLDDILFGRPGQRGGVRGHLNRLEEAFGQAGA